MQLIVHGGAGRIATGRQRACLAGCERAARAGWACLVAGGSAVEAVETAVRVLEDDPLFNAGRGGVLRADGRLQLDASLMDGVTQRAGAVGIVEGIRHPITLARRVMDDGRHVLLAGRDAMDFARQQGIAVIDPAHLIVRRQQRRWKASGGTVGGVARDAADGLAAGTSTGGVFGALPGRIGDSALIGCGTYADACGAVSCTGLGEAIMRTVLAHTTASHLAAGEVPHRAGEDALARLAAVTGCHAGLIIIDRRGRLAHPCTTEHMPVAWVEGDGRVHSALT